MKVCHTLIFLLLVLSSLQDGYLTMDIDTRFGTEGQNVLVVCNYDFSGRRKIFCRDNCREENILVETNGDRGQHGRYRIAYIRSETHVSINVSISNLTKTDSGTYRCVLERNRFFRNSKTFELRVQDAEASPKSNLTPAMNATNSGSEQYVRLILVIIIIASSSAVLIVCRRRSRTPEEPHVRLCYINFINADQVYDNDGEDSAVGTSTV